MDNISIKREELKVMCPLKSQWIMPIITASLAAILCFVLFACGEPIENMENEQTGDVIIGNEEDSCPKAAAFLNHKIYVQKDVNKDRTSELNDLCNKDERFFSYFAGCNKDFSVPISIVSEEDSCEAVAQKRAELSKLKKQEEEINGWILVVCRNLHPVEPEACAV